VLLPARDLLWRSAERIVIYLGEGGGGRLTSKGAHAHLEGSKPALCEGAARPGAASAGNEESGLRCGRDERAHARTYQRTNEPRLVYRQEKPRADLAGRDH